jgi:hypothetical protein
MSLLFLKRFVLLSKREWIKATLLVLGFCGKNVLKFLFCVIGPIRESEEIKFVRWEVYQKFVR